jgi:NADPH-dependent glutamate synthase beta subunit-like oxidoreductase
VFEKDPVAGGHMTKGMPEFRIPGADVQKEIDDIAAVGVKIQVNSPVENVAALKKDYDAVLVTIGTSVGKKLSYLPGSDYRNVYTAVQLLKDNRLKLAVPGYEMKLDLGKTVSIIGGGNVSMDCARTLRRMGCEVNIVCLEKGDKMLADKQEIQEAQEEGVRIYDGHSNEAIEGTPDQVTGLRVHEVESFYFDENRNLVENQIPDSTKVLPCDSIVFASGQVTGLTADFGLELNRFGYPVDPETGKSGFKTSVEGVFTAGDVITGTKFVIDAIAGGRDAASAIDKYLGGDGEIDETLVERTLSPELGPVKGFGTLPRVETNILDAETRMSEEGKWGKVDLNFTCDQAQCEAGRCLQCDLRVPIQKVENFNAYSKR